MKGKYLDIPAPKALDSWLGVSRFAVVARNDDEGARSIADLIAIDYLSVAAVPASVMQVLTSRTGSRSAVLR